MKRRPKIGEPRRTRQPLRIDRLPIEARDAILRLRNQEGRTWAEIEELSHKFAGELLPATTLARWYDLRWEQVQKETQARSERARVFAAALAGKDFKHWPDAVKNFLGDTIFALAEGGPKDAALIKAVTEMGWLLQEYRKSDLKQQSLELEKKKFEESKRKFEKATSEAAEKIGKGKSLTVEDINRIRERTFGLPPV